MRKQHTKQVSLVHSLLDKPNWYNETITHPNWAIVKQAIKKQQPIGLMSMPPKLQENYDKLQELRNYQKSLEFFALQPPITIIGATT